mmetsp:Transcript_21219/g.35024  ORF Transcript_21219/g.35024 Transcript_21219/m.35024 type:complete len:102 (+) Transcript_21219:403-708(+)
MALLQNNVLCNLALCSKVDLGRQLERRRAHFFLPSDLKFEFIDRFRCLWHGCSPIGASERQTFQKRRLFSNLCLKQQHSSSSSQAAAWQVMNGTACVSILD